MFCVPLDASKSTASAKWLNLEASDKESDASFYTDFESVSSCSEVRKIKNPLELLEIGADRQSWQVQMSSQQAMVRLQRYQRCGGNHGSCQMKICEDNIIFKSYNPTVFSFSHLTWVVEAIWVIWYHDMSWTSCDSCASKKYTWLQWEIPREYRSLLNSVMFKLRLGRRWSWNRLPKVHHLGVGWFDGESILESDSF